MARNYLLVTAILSILMGFLLLSGSDARDDVPPRIINTHPHNGARDVVPSLRENSVTFSEQMMDKSWSWCYEVRDTFPQVTGQPYYTENNTKNVLPVRLEPNKEYVICG